MKRLDRRKFMLLASVGTTGAVLTACGNDPDDVDLNPTMIPDAEGAPPTLAPQATPRRKAAVRRSRSKLRIPLRGASTSWMPRRVR
jgi:hypothetical protein